MRSFDINTCKQRIFRDNFAPYINMLRQKVAKFIDALAREQNILQGSVPVILHKNVPYWGTVPDIPGNKKSYYVTTSVAQREQFLELIKPIEDIKDNIKYLDWYFGHLHLSMNSTADLYEALPTTLHNYLPRNDNQPITPNIRDDKAYKILQEIKVMQLLLKN